MSTKPDFDFIFFSFYDVIILAAIMISYIILVFFMPDKAYFENDSKHICHLRVPTFIKLQKNLLFKFG